MIEIRGTVIPRDEDDALEVTPQSVILNPRYIVLAESHDVVKEKTGVFKHLTTIHLMKPTNPKDPGKVLVNAPWGQVTAVLRSGHGLIESVPADPVEKKVTA